MALVLNLLTILFASSLVQRSLALENVVNQRDDRQAKERILSPRESHMYKGHSKTRTENASFDQNNSDGIQKYGSIMEYPIPEGIDVKMASLRYLHVLSSQKAHKNRTQKHVKTDSLAHRPHLHRNSELQQMEHTSTSLMDTAIGGDQRTSLTGLRSGPVKSLPVGPFGENSASYQKEKSKIKSVSSNVRGCPVERCDRQLCPWTMEMDVQRNRSPMNVLYASCKSTTCNVQSLFGIFWRSYFDRQTECDTVVNAIQVYVDGKPTHQRFPVACICRYKYRRHVPSNSSNVQPHAYSDLLKTGPMTRTVELGELEMIDGTEPEIPNSDFPVRHRKRKLRQHHGNESSDQQEETEETKIVTQS